MLHPRVHTPAGKSRFAPSRPPAPRSDAVNSTSPNKVRVVARIRPFLPSEIDRHPLRDPAPCVKSSASHGEHTLHISDPKSSRQGSYKLDFCYGEEDDVSLIFAREVEPLLPALLRGFNATVFAYGATGSGKTYTMQGLENRPGLMPLALTSILTMSENTDCRINVSYYEVYMDRCYDLLEAKATEVSVFEDSDGKIQLRGLSQVNVRTLAEFGEVFLNGCLRRRVGQTGLNDASSRSHGVLMVTVTSGEKTTGIPVVGKLNLIDLAGNEDNRRTGNEGVRLAESARINQSLFALSNVITALNSNEGRVPYRDSKLTRILQDSLGGTSRALMIACLSPKSYQEAAHTLSLAARSRQIMNQVPPGDRKEDSQVQVDMEAKLQAWLEAKGTGPHVSPSPWKDKPRFYTPSRHHINQLRQLQGNFAKDPGATPKARRILASSLRAHNVDQEKERALTETSPQASGASAKEKKLLCSQALATCASQAKSSCCDEGNQVEGLNCSKGVPEESCHPASGTEKENFREDLLTSTPCVKLINGSSSPPLSERLQNLRTAMREILQPISNNVTANAPFELSSNPTMRCLSPEFTPQNLSPMLSPEKTPARKVDLEGQNTGTPLEKFSKNSSGIKSTWMKEYFDFLNTASRRELLELRGIGEKRAEYILSLRDTSPEPFKELDDLEKMGLSKKQALSLFKDTARQIF